MHMQISDDSKVTTWIHSNRLPLFWNSDLYFEYCLCCEMVNNNEGIIICALCVELLYLCYVV